MSHKATDQSTREPDLASLSLDSITLHDILHNHLVLTNVVPFLPVQSLLALAATDHTTRALIHQTPGTFRYLDLRRVRKAQFDIDAIDHGGQVWRNVQLDENITEDDFYSGPLRGIFSALERRSLLSHVQTLILDGLPVTSDLVHDIITSPQFNVRILSLRGVKNLNHGKLRGSLTYACRSSRPNGTPRLRGLYIFGSPEAPLLEGTPSLWNQKSKDALDPWWSRKGRMLNIAPKDWTTCLVSCEGIVAFDAVLCKGPRHCNSSAYGTVHIASTPAVSASDNSPAIATYAVPPCSGCGTAPEGMTRPDQDPRTLPLLAPPPVLSTSLKAATAPHTPYTPFVPRCGDCLTQRYCNTCKKWWCESCYRLPGDHGQVHIATDDGIEWGSLLAGAKTQARVTKSCWECGFNCDDCIDATQRSCRKCCAGYCIIHNEGSSSTFCDCMDL